MASRKLARAKARGPYHHGDLRRALVAAAIAALSEEGAAGMTLRSLARRAGVSHAAPYAHFRDKAALLAAVAAAGFEQLTKAMREAGGPIPASASRAQHRLVAIGGAYVRFGVEHASLYRLMFGAPDIVDASVKEELHQRAAEALAELRDTLSAIGLDVQSTATGIGHAAPPLSEPTLTAWSAVHGLTLLLIDRRAGPSALSPTTGERLGRTVAEDVLKGLRSYPRGNR